MKIQNSVNSIYFTAQMPKKKTYSAMKEYYKSIGNRDKENYFEKLDNRARLRLHNKKSNQEGEKLFDLDDEADVTPMTFKENLQYAKEHFKGTYKTLKETLLTTYYSLKG